MSDCNCGKEHFCKSEVNQLRAALAEEKRRHNEQCKSACESGNRASEEIAMLRAEVESLNVEIDELTWKYMDSANLSEHKETQLKKLLTLRNVDRENERLRDALLAIRDRCGAEDCWCQICTDAAPIARAALGEK